MNPKIRQSGVLLDEIHNVHYIVFSEWSWMTERSWISGGNSSLSSYFLIDRTQCFTALIFLRLYLIGDYIAWVISVHRSVQNKYVNILSITNIRPWHCLHNCVVYMWWLRGVTSLSLCSTSHWCGNIPLCSCVTSVVKSVNLSVSLNKVIKPQKWSTLPCCGLLYHNSVPSLPI